MSRIKKLKIRVLELYRELRRVPDKDRVLAEIKRIEQEIKQYDKG